MTRILVNFLFTPNRTPLTKSVKEKESNFDAMSTSRT